MPIAPPQKADNMFTPVREYCAQVVIWSAVFALLMSPRATFAATFAAKSAATNASVLTCRQSRSGGCSRNSAFRTNGSMTGW
jgi:hypothetical protein